MRLVPVRVVLMGLVLVGVAGRVLPLGTRQRSLWTGLCFVALEALVVRLALRAGRRTVLSAPTRRAWRLLAVAVAASLFSDAWALTVTARGGSALDSAPIAAGYVAFYAFMLAALVRLPVRQQWAAERTVLGLDLAIVAVGGLAVVWYTALGPILRLPAAPATRVLLMAYPVGDLVLLLAAARLLTLGSGPEVARPVRAVLAGVACFVGADLAVQLAGVQTALAGWPQLFFLAGHALYGAAALRQLAQPVEAPPPGTRRPSGTLPAPSLLPYAATAIIYLLILRSAADVPLYPLGGLLVATLAVTGLVLARQLLVVREHARLAAEAHARAATDGLTGALTRRWLEELADAELARAARHGRPVGVLLIDVDHFKTVNDQHGHPAGDGVLAEIAHRAQRCLRATDLLGRYGGDEFLAVLPEAGSKETRHAAERVLGAVHAEPVRVGHTALPVTVSVGAASLVGPASLSALVSAADEALYHVKQDGRAGARLAVPRPRDGRTPVASP